VDRAKPPRFNVRLTHFTCTRAESMPVFVVALRTCPTTAASSDFAESPQSTRPNATRDGVHSSTTATGVSGTVIRRTGSVTRRESNRSCRICDDQTPFHRITEKLPLVSVPALTCLLPVESSREKEICAPRSGRNVSESNTVP
jgi:hypothetical protein